jgi:sugar/nucleoside kinase (ribokinase family)
LQHENISIFHDQGVDVVLNIGVKELNYLKRKRSYTNASDKIDKVMDSTGAGDAFGLDFYLPISRRKLLRMFDIALKLAALKLPWAIAR